MSEFDERQRIKSKLNAYQADIPGFDDLFRDEVPGEARLRHVCQSKLQDFMTDAPAFEDLMQSPQPVVIPFKKRVSPLWWTISAMSAAAACMACWIFLPKPAEIKQSTISLLSEQPDGHHVRKFGPRVSRIGASYLTQKLTTPQVFACIDVAPPRIAVVSHTASQTEEHIDSVYRESLSKLSQQTYAALDVFNRLGVEEAYARARASKRHHHPDKFLAGLHLSSGNRLLSFVNINQSNNPIQSVANQYSKGLSALEGNPVSMLRAAEVSRNEWTSPGNIPATSLSKYEVHYSLPWNAGLSLAIPISDLFEIQTGITYTYLSSLTTGNIGTSTFDLHQKLHYLGIPLTVDVNIYNGSKFRFYAGVGGAIEKGLAGTQYSHVVSASGDVDDWRSTQRVYGVQPLVKGQLGVSYDIASSYEFYLEPGGTYSIPNDQPVSSRTEEPFYFNIGFGLRYRLK